MKKDKTETIHKVKEISSDCEFIKKRDSLKGPWVDEKGIWHCPKEKEDDSKKIHWR